MNVDDLHMPHDSDLESHQDHYHNQPEGLGVADSDEGVFTGHINEAGMLPTTDLCPNASQTYGKGHTFLDLFYSDENSIYHTKNLYYPFSSQKEWEVVSWLLHSGLSMGKINSFLSLEMIKDLSLLAEMLPSGPHWMSQVIPMAHPTKSPIVLYWCDPFDCISSILNHPTFHGELDFMPCRVDTTAQWLYCVYTKWMTADDAWKMQSNLPSGATLLGTILSSDKTNISMMTGDRVAHPLLISLTNICMSIRFKASLGAFLLTALLPVPKFTHKKHFCCLGKVTPNNIEVFFREAQKFCLNRVDKPFWLDWVMTEPSHFLTLKFFTIFTEFGEAEIYFHFSVLQPVMGFHHFHSGISKLKQVTGCAQHDIQHPIITTAADAVPSISGKVIDNWYIPKLELMQSIAPSIHNTGVAMQWTTDTTEHTHICCHLDHADKCCHCELAVNLLDLLNQHAYLDEDNNNINIDIDDDRDILATVNCLGYSWPITDYFAITQILLHKEVGTIPQPLRTFVVGQSLADFLHHEDTYGNDHIHAIGGARRAGPDALLPFDKMQIWFKVRLQDMDPAQTLNCAPPCDLWTSGQYDTVIVNHEEGYSWPADGLHTTRLHLLKRVKQSNGTWIGDIIPVTQFRAPINVVPCFSASADNHLTPYNSTKHSSEFWLNRYWDKNTFFPLLM
ncbi:hypothetical protein BDR06DRAFT_983361 [Suillus hirtellus]|nr:hypothetical protein BDR06DRAFT_983361 [Suillus hirtellus]